MTGLAGSSTSSPDRTRLYFSSQRGPTPRSIGEIIPGAEGDAKIGGITYEVTGPFRSTEPPEDATPATTLAQAQDGSSSTEDGEDEGTNVVPIVVGATVAAAAIAGGVVALRRRREDPPEA